jgi:geranylgeranyl pyrophosphate synthase
VLNLRGFKNNLKARGEDIRNGTITLPVVKALGRLNHDDRVQLWKTLASKPSDDQVVASTVEKLEACGAVTACERQARELVESSWKAADPLLPDSLPKVMLRAFGWYVLERHY